MVDAKSLFELIETRRMQLGLTQAQVTERALKTKGGTSVIQNLRRGSIPSAQKLKAICDALGLEFYIGDPRDQAVVESVVTYGFSEIGTLPLHGFVSSDDRGWGHAEFDGEKLAGPSDLQDQDAFYVQMGGESMRPDGIEQGALCLISPAVPPQSGAQVWIKDQNGRTAIKRLTNLTDDTVFLRGWLPAKGGAQAPYDERVLRAYVTELYPVVLVSQHDKLSSNDTPEPHQNTAGKGVVPDTDDGLVTIGLHNLQRSRHAGNATLVSLAFPNNWIRQKRTSGDRLSLVLVQGEDMSPTLAANSVVLIDQGRTSPVRGALFAICLEGKVRVVRLEQPNRSTLIISGDNPAAASRVLVGAEIQAAEVLGQVIWAGRDF